MGPNALSRRHHDFQRVPRSHATLDDSPNHFQGVHIPAKVDISSILRAPELYEPTVSPARQSREASVSQQATPPRRPPPHQHTQPQPAPAAYASRPIAPASRPSGRRSMPSTAADQPAKKQSKWSPEEDALIIELRGSGMKWEDISKQLPGRSAISCRLHYQNYLERRSEWSEERKDKLAQLYER